MLGPCPVLSVGYEAKGPVGNHRVGRVTGGGNADEVARGGRDFAFFCCEDKQLIGQSLRDNAARVGDRDLRAGLDRVAQTWDQAFATAPPSIAFIDLEAPVDSERQRRLAAVAEVARRGLDECAAVLARINALEAGS